MPPPRRGAKVPRRKRKRRLGTLLLIVGVLAVLGGTFAVGAIAGRLSLRPSASLASPPKPTERAPKPQTREPQHPELTFYRELTAPLTPLPVPPKPSARPVPKREPAPAVPTPPAAEASAADAARPRGDVAAASPLDATRYTVQVAAYTERAQADALRARLAAAGHDVYVMEGDTGGIKRFRVRIGTYASLDEARQAAARIGAQAHVGTYVTTR